MGDLSVEKYAIAINDWAIICTEHKRWTANVCTSVFGWDTKCLLHVAFIGAFL